MKCAYFYLVLIKNIFSILAVHDNNLYSFWFFFNLLQAVTESAQLSTQNQLASSQTDHDPMRSDVKYDYERPVNGHNFHPDYLDVHISQGAEPDPVILSSTGESQVMHVKLLHHLW
jgi:hypothetical protein